MQCKMGLPQTRSLRPHDTHLTRGMYSKVILQVIFQVTLLLHDQVLM